jgi:hypothetical protein
MSDATNLKGVMLTNRPTYHKMPGGKVKMTAKKMKYLIAHGRKPPFSCT